MEGSNVNNRESTESEKLFNSFNSGYPIIDTTNRKISVFNYQMSMI